MEEIVSTETLEREILEEARKKADRLLRDAGEELKRIKSAGEAKAEKALAALAAEYARRGEAARAEILARLPLEKTRMKTDWAEALLARAAEDYLASLPAATIDGLYARYLERAAGLMDGSEYRLSFRGLSPERARAIAAASLPRGRLAELREEPGLPAPGLLAESLDRRLRAGADLDLLREELLDRGRGELAAALCGKALEP